MKSFEEATGQVIVNLDAELAAFKEKIKKEPEQVKVVNRQGYTGGGGASGTFELALLLGIFVVVGRRLGRGHEAIKKNAGTGCDSLHGQCLKQNGFRVRSRFERPVCFGRSE